MTRRIVKETLDTEVANFLAAQIPPVPFYDTDDLPDRPTDEVWVTSVYYSDIPTQACYQHLKSFETGSAVMTIFTRAGKSFTTAYTLADEIQDFFRAYLGATVEVVNVMSASEATQGDAVGNYYAVDVEIFFRHAY